MKVDKIKNMMDKKIRKLQESAISSVRERVFDITLKSGESNALNMAAYMDIEKTTETLNEILLYKQELAKLMLECPSELQMEIIADSITYADNMIRKVLGMENEPYPFL